MNVCRNCIYYDACGSSTRTEKCNGRSTKREVSARQKEESCYGQHNSEKERVLRVPPAG